MAPPEDTYNEPTSATASAPVPPEVFPEELEAARAGQSDSEAEQRRLVREEGLSAEEASAQAAATGDGLESKSKEELYDLATEKDIAGRSDMNKEQLIDALRSA